MRTALRTAGIMAVILVVAYVVSVWTLNPVAWELAILGIPCWLVWIGLRFGYRAVKRALSRSIP